MQESQSLIDAIGATPDLSSDLPAVAAVPRDFTTKRLLMVALLLLVGVAFANSLSGAFVHDDLPQIVENQMFGHWDRATLTRLVTRDFWAALQPELAGNHLNSLYYRPAFSLFLMAGYEVVGRSPAGWHLLVILLHALCAVLAFVVLEKTLRMATTLVDRQCRLLAACAAAIFAVHPAQAESVTWVAGLVGPLSTVFMLSVFYCYLIYRQRRRAVTLAAILLLFALAVLTKESAIILILIVAAHELLVFDRDAGLVGRLRGAALQALPFALIGAGYMVVRYLVLGVWFGRVANLNFPDDASLTAVDMVRTWPALIVAYGKLMFWPVDLSLMYNFRYIAAIGWANFWLPLLVVIGVGFLLLRLARRNVWARLGAIWFVIPILPHLNTRAFVSDEIIHDRYLYLSLLGAGLFIGALLVEVRANRKWLAPRFALGLTVLLLAGLTLLTVATNRRFQNSEVLWPHIAAHAPNSRIALIGTALGAETRGDKETALRTYETVLTIHPDILDALNNSAFIYARGGHWGEATRRFERIVELTPDRAGAHFNLSFAYAVQRRYGEAVREQQRAIELDPNNARVTEWRARLDDLRQRQAAMAAGGR